MTALLATIRVGDQVRVTNPHSGHMGRTGAVVEVQPWGLTGVALIVDFGGGERRSFFAGEVERV